MYCPFECRALGLSAGGLAGGSSGGAKVAKGSMNGLREGVWTDWVPVLAGERNGFLLMGVG